MFIGSVILDINNVLNDKIQLIFMNAPFYRVIEGKIKSENKEQTRTVTKDKGRLTTAIIVSILIIFLNGIFQPVNAVNTTSNFNIDSNLIAGFTADPTSGPVPLTVQFSDLSSGAPVSWLWTFGDGGTSSEQNPSYTYSYPGSYTVSLTAINRNSFRYSYSQFNYIFVHYDSINEQLSPDSIDEQFQSDPINEQLSPDSNGEQFQSDSFDEQLLPDSNGEQFQSDPIDEQLSSDLNGEQFQSDSIDEQLSSDLNTIRPSYLSHDTVSINEPDNRGLISSDNKSSDSIMNLGEERIVSSKNNNRNSTNWTFIELDPLKTQQQNEYMVSHVVNVFRSLLP